MSYISVQGLCKHFDVRQKREKGSLLRKKERVQALQDVSFDVEQGELVGYIGPNGAGKSTTVKILSGIMVPDSGNVAVGGLTPWENRKEHVRRIGVVFGQRMQLWWDVPIADSYDLLKDIYRIPERFWSKAGFPGRTAGSTRAGSALYSASGCSSGGMCRSWTAMIC